MAEPPLLDMNPALAADTLALIAGGGLPIDLVAPHRIPIDPRHFSDAGLRFYQEIALREVAALFRRGYRRVLLQLPTGGGKTVIATAAHRSADLNGLASQFLVHRKELIDQTSASFARAGLEHGFVAAGRPFSPDASIVIAGIQTLVNRLVDILPPNLVLVDECHHATAATWARVLAAYEEEGAFVLGLTGTPERLDGQGLDEHFDAMVLGPSPAQLIEWGYLSEFDYFAPTIPDLSGVRTVAGDFNRGAAADIMDKPKLIGDVVDHYTALAPGQQGIVFAASREHSQHMADAIGAAGHRAAHVDGAMSDAERSRIVEAFRAGDIRVMTNVDLFGEGFDVPGIVYVGLARPTKSLSLHLQQVGRALRVIEGKDRAVIADHAGNVFRLGLPDDEREWSLHGRPKQTRGGANDDAMPVRQCKSCYRVSPSTVRTCPGCGEDFPVQQRKLEQEEGKLSKIEAAEAREKLRRMRQAENRACKSFADFKALAVQRGYPSPAGWAKVQVRLRGSAPRI